MFFREKKSGDRVYLEIVENRWEQGRSKQRVIATLGRLERLTESGQLDALLQSGSKFSESIKGARGASRRGSGRHLHLANWIGTRLCTSLGRTANPASHPTPARRSTVHVADRADFVSHCTAPAVCFRERPLLPSGLETEPRDFRYRNDRLAPDIPRHGVAARTKRPVVNEVPAPHMVLVFSPTANATVAAVAQTPFFTRFLRHFQAFLHPKSINPLGVHVPTFLAKLGHNHSISIPRILPRQLVQPHGEILLLGGNLSGAIPLRAPWHGQCLAYPTLRNSQPVPRSPCAAASGLPVSLQGFLQNRFVEFRLRQQLLQPLVLLLKPL